MNTFIQVEGRDARATRELSNDDLREIGPFTRANVSAFLDGKMDSNRACRRAFEWADWIEILPAVDFHAVCGDIDIPWATEKSR